MKFLSTLVLTTLFLCSTAIAQPAPADDPGTQPEPSDFRVPPELHRHHTLEELQLLVTPLTLEQLTVEADKWQGHVQATMNEIAHLKIQAINAEGTDSERIHKKINEVTAQRTEMIGKFDMIVDSMELKGAAPEDTDKYRKFITGALASELQATDAKTIASQALDWTASRDGGIRFIIGTVSVIGSMFLLWIIARFIRALAARGIRRITTLSLLLQDFLLKTIFWLSFIVGLLIVLSLFGVNITPLFAVVGGASFILAFAMQDTLGNLASGLMIMINKPFDVGDLIDTNGIMGEVKAVSIVSTTVRTMDNQVVILPNSAVWGSIITNVTVSPIRRIDMVFGIGYSDDIEAAHKVLQDLVSAHPKILDDPEPKIKVHELADSSVNFICRPWSKTEDYWDVYWDLTRQVKEGFDAAGVSIPFPQRDVHLFKEG